MVLASKTLSLPPPSMKARAVRLNTLCVTVKPDTCAAREQGGSSGALGRDSGRGLQAGRRTHLVVKVHHRHVVAGAQAALDVREDIAVDDVALVREVAPRVDGAAVAHDRHGVVDAAAAHLVQVARDEDGLVRSAEDLAVGDGVADVAECDDWEQEAGRFDPPVKVDSPPFFLRGA